LVDERAEGLDLIDERVEGLDLMRGLRVLIDR
jgi:hypothetical protein